MMLKRVLDDAWEILTELILPVLAALLMLLALAYVVGVGFRLGVGW